VQQMHRADDNHAWKQAEDFARIAVGIRPNDADAHLVLGDALSRQNINNPEAMRELERAQQLTGDHELLSTILSRQGEILEGQGKLQQALEYFNRARAVAPIDAHPRTDAALVMLKLQPGMREQVVALLTQVVNDSPWYTAAYIALANVAENDGDVKGAEEWYSKGLARNENSPDLLFAEGEFYARQHQLDRAKATLTLALKYETRADNLQTIANVLAGLK
jgi:tetratricopeptide (TPR) repeat protein